MSAMTAIVVSTLGAGLATALLGWLFCGDLWGGLVKWIGGPSWDFSKSWGSNVTVVGAILGTVLSSKVLPDHPTVVASPNGYTALSLLFGALVVMAPFLFVTLSSVSGSTSTEGRGWAFLVSVAVTLWGVIGELVTVGLVLYEAHHGGTLTLGAVLPMWSVMGVAVALVGVYGFRSVRAMLAPKHVAHHHPAEFSPVRAVTLEGLTIHGATGEPLTFVRPGDEPLTLLNVGDPAIDVLTEKPPSWSLL